MLDVLIGSNNSLLYTCTEIPSNYAFPLDDGEKTAFKTQDGY